MDKSEETIPALVRRLERNYITGTTKIGKYVEKSMYETLERIEAYLNSKHISGDKDSKGRDKPFFNIVTASVNIWFRATDIDTKNIRVRATKLSHKALAFIASILVSEWMRKTSFGQFLNDWGRALARYGSTVVKFVEKDGELITEIVPWNRLIVDPVDFENNPVIEKIYLTEGQLYQREGYDKAVVEALCESLKARETLGRQKKDIRNDYIELYEIHGNMPLSMLTDNEDDDDTYVQQMHVVSFVASGDARKKEWNDFTLIRGREKQSPYMLTHLIKEDGQSLSIGAVEHLFEAQWMINHNAKAIKDQLDLASKLIFQTSDGNFVGRNATQNIDTGDILVHDINQPITQVANNSHDITSLQNYSSQWKALAQEITSTPDALMGNNAPSGTAWRQVEALQQEAHSLFELMTENKGLYIEEMFQKFIVPHLKKKMDTSDEIAAILSAEQIEKLDGMYIPKEAAKRATKDIVDMVINMGKGGPAPTPQDQAMLNQMHSQGLKEALNSNGSQRFIKPSDVSDTTWKDLMKDLEWDLEVDVTGESAFNKEDLATLTTVFQTIANPATAGILNTPAGKLLFSKILDKTSAVSSIELSELLGAQAIQPQVPAPAQIGGQVGGTPLAAVSQ
jgi:hypothetical protein